MLGQVLQSPLARCLVGCIAEFSHQHVHGAVRILGYGKTAQGHVHKVQRLRFIAAYVACPCPTQASVGVDFLEGGVEIAVAQLVVGDFGALVVPVAYLVLLAVRGQLVEPAFQTEPLLPARADVGAVRRYQHIERGFCLWTMTVSHVLLVQLPFGVPSRVNESLQFVHIVRCHLGIGIKQRFTHSPDFCIVLFIHSVLRPPMLPRTLFVRA